MADYLTPTQMRLLRRLVEANGAYVSRDTLYDALYAHRSKDGPDPKVMDHHIYDLRKLLAPGSIETWHRFGWRIAPEARAAAAAFLEAHLVPDAATDRDRLRMVMLEAIEELREPTRQSVARARHVLTAALQET